MGDIDNDKGEDVNMIVNIPFALPDGEEMTVSKVPRNVQDDEVVYIPLKGAELRKIYNTLAYELAIMENENDKVGLNLYNKIERICVGVDFGHDQDMRGVE